MVSIYTHSRLDEKWASFLIPFTIIAAAAFNWPVKDLKPPFVRINYFLALFFGLIRGMGFANTICFMPAKGRNIAVPPISFNIGLQAVQMAGSK